MVKKGDILNQLAIISDLIEKSNIETVSNTVLFILNDEEFQRIFNILETKSKTKLKIVKDKFSLKVGDVDIIFNRNNV